ncbi:hypothetical protein D3C81_1058830 [compost metagenome]
MVDIRPFHQFHLSFHLLSGHYLTMFRIGLMTVDTFQFHRLAIDIIITSGQAKFIISSLGVFNLNLSKSNVGRNSLYGFVLFILQFSYQSIPIW